MRRGRAKPVKTAPFAFMLLNREARKRSHHPAETEDFLGAFLCRLPSRMRLAIGMKASTKGEGLFDQERVTLATPARLMA